MSGSGRERQFRLGTEGVVPVERASEADGWAELEGPTDRPPPRKSGHIRRPGIADRGEDAKRGDLVARSGERITPGKLAVLAAVGAARIAVWGEPSLAVVVTGHEVVPPGRKPTAVQIRNTNEDVVAAVAASSGASSVSRLGIIEDDSASLIGALRRGLEARRPRRDRRRVRRSSRPRAGGAAGARCADRSCTRLRSVPASRFSSA